MFFNADDSDVTQEEKINYLYAHVRKTEFEAKLNNIWKWSYRLFFIGSMLYIYLHPSSIFDLAKSLTGDLIQKPTMSSIVGGAVKSEGAELKSIIEGLNK